MLIPSESSVGYADATIYPVTPIRYSCHWDGCDSPQEIAAVKAHLEIVKKNRSVDS